MGYVKRVKGAFVGALFGLLLFPSSFVLLGWNERDAVRQTGAITEVEDVVLADVPESPVDPANEGLLVHIGGNCQTDAILENRELAIRENAIRLRWDASIYQWKEEKHERDDRTEYEYKQQWSDDVIDSSRFHRSGHSNEGSVKHFHDGQEQAQDVRLGEFALSKNLIGKIGNEQVMPIPESAASDIQPPGRVSNGVFYTGDPGNPEIGDEKIEVFVVGPRQDVTVMAKQSDRTFTPYETKVGISKEILYMGLLSKEQVIERQRFEAAMKRWLIRGGGFLAMWLGLALVLGPIRATLSGIPILGRLVGGAIGFVTFLMALLLSAITIAVAWFVVRPVMSITCLVVAAFCLYFLLKRGTQEPSPITPPPTPSAPPPLPG